MLTELRSGQQYGREYQLSVGPRAWTDLHVKARVRRTLGSHPNSFQIQVWNLNEDSRAMCEERGADVRLLAGYTGNVGTIFAGSLWDAVHERQEGDIVTTIKANDGDKNWRNQLRKSWASGTPKEQVLRACAETLGIAVDPDALALVTGSYGGPRVVNGPAVMQVDRIATSLGLQWSVQNGQLLMVPMDGTTNEAAVVLSPETGLVGSPAAEPRRKPSKSKPAQRGMVECTALCNPLLTPGRLVILRALDIRGNYRVDEADFDLDSHGSDWVVNLRLRPV
jgi:hypothetical protein